MKYEINAIWSIDINDEPHGLTHNEVFEDFVDLLLEETNGHAMFELASIHPVKEEE